MRGWRRARWSSCGVYAAPSLLGADLRAIATAVAVALAALFAPSPACARFGPEQVAVIVNADDPSSVETGLYYARARGVPVEQVLAVRLGRPRPNLQSAEFEPVYRSLSKRTPEHVQAFVLTWAEPYRVDCMSITSAFAFGFDRLHCAQGCEPTALSPYFDARTHQPYQDFGLRPTMAVAASSGLGARRLIDRGVRADDTRPAGVGYLVSTSDPARNVRARRYRRTVEDLGERFDLRIVETDRLTERFDVMFYFTGLKRVPGLARLGFRPGAVADHLTSAGGKLTDSRQMSALEWIRAGVTGTYGAVVEPCNFPQKFPDPYTLIKHYTAGDTLIEAYWKSVAWPGQGVFVGEPLARPFEYRVR